MFYTIVLSVAIILLIIILTYIGLRMASDAKVDSAYPPNKMTCPDLWNMVEDSGNIKCIIPEYSEDQKDNSGSLYSNAEQLKPTVSNAPGYSEGDNTTGARIDFSSTGWAGYSPGLSADCSKRAWAIEHSVLWDGITNYNACG